MPSQVLASGPRRAGRTRSEAARLAILEAAFDLVATRGYSAVTTQDIAARARVGKQTIYRWWPGKADLVLDALHHHGAVEIDPTPGSVPCLTAFLERVCAGMTRARPVLRSLMAQAQFDPLLRRDLKVRLIEPRREALRAVLLRTGVADEVRRETLILAIYGALWCRLLLDEPLDAAFVRTMAGLADGA